MSVNVTQTYSFIQQGVQGSGGWCMGISLGIIKTIQEYSANPNDPNRAYEVSEQVCRSLMMATYDDRLASFRARVRQMQNYYGHGLSPYADGAFDYSLDRPFLLLLGLYVDPNNEHSTEDPGAGFQGRWGFSEANHAGVAAWNGTQTLFVFDPNTGGALATVSGIGLIAAIDVVLAVLYVEHDRMNITGLGRRAVLKWARSVTGGEYVETLF